MRKSICTSAASAGAGRWLTRGLLAALILPAGPGFAFADKLILQLHREPQFEFAGYYAALWKGFYRDAGLDVEIRPGAPPGGTPIDPVREIVERRAQFGTGTAELLIRAGQGAPLLLVAPIFQQSGAAVYFRADSDFSTPQALLRAKIGHLPASNILDAELRTALHAAGIDPDKMKSAAVEPGKAAAALADRRVDAVLGSAWELPWQLRERSVAAKSLSLAGLGPAFYGDGLFTSQRFANADATTVQRFREASIKGWEYALQHSDEIAARIVAELPVAAPVSDPAGFARYQGDVARKLARFPDVPIGRSDPARWDAIQQSLIAAGAMAHPVDLKAFLYDAGAAASGFPARKLAALVCGAGLLLVFFVIAGLRRLRRGWTELAQKIAVLRGGVRPFALMRAWVAQWRAMKHRAVDRLGEAGARLAASISGGPRPRMIDLNAALVAFEPRIRRRLPPAVTCRFSLLPEPLHCAADPNVLATCLLDLAAEAAAAMADGGELVVGARRSPLDDAAAAEYPGSMPGDYGRVTVKDAGPGLSPERLDQIFYPDKTTRPAVAAAWQAMQRLGGFAAVESAEGVGTAVHLYFRRMPAGDERREPAALAEVQALAAE
jgi:ABC-type nitrate/sulfonate/bicarbonate transport system substrate-binding protein